jgi:hypothetical protein
MEINMSNIPDREYEEWLATLHHEIVIDPTWTETPLIDGEVLIQWEKLAQWEASIAEYVQELEDQGLIPLVPAMDMDERFLIPEQEQQLDFDFDR